MFFFRKTFAHCLSHFSLTIFLSSLILSFSRWSAPALQFLVDNKIEMFVLPSHSSIWSQPNDLGPNSRFKKFLGQAFDNHALAMSILGQKLTVPKFNMLLAEAWLAMMKEERLELNKRGSNACTRAYARSGLYPDTLQPPEWKLACETFGSLGCVDDGEEEIVAEEGPTGKTTLVKRKNGEIAEIGDWMGKVLKDFLDRPTKEAREELVEIENRKRASKTEGEVHGSTRREGGGHWTAPELRG